MTSALIQVPVSIQLLSGDRIRQIHDQLFGPGRMGHNPALGMRDSALLDQAVACQFACSLGGDAREKAAALVQGLMDERPFFEGNAETAFLALLLHLDLNGFEPNRVSFDEYFRCFSAMAGHKLDQLGGGRSRLLPKRKAGVLEGECELSLLSQWLVSKTRPLERQDYPLELSQVVELLFDRGYSVYDAGEGMLEVVRRDTQVEKRFFGLGSRTSNRLVPLLKFRAPAEGPVHQTTLRDIRKACGLASQAFYDFRARLDSFLRSHQTLLTRLARL